MHSFSNILSTAKRKYTWISKMCTFHRRSVILIQQRSPSLVVASIRLCFIKNIVTGSSAIGHHQDSSKLAKHRVDVTWPRTATFYLVLQLTNSFDSFCMSWFCTSAMDPLQIWFITISQLHAFCFFIINIKNSE